MVGPNQFGSQLRLALHGYSRAEIYPPMLLMTVAAFEVPGVRMEGRRPPPAHLTPVALWCFAGQSTISGVD
jgi:hypothetical protein